MTYSAKTFSLPALSGISQDQIDVHLKLYEGYVKNTNLIMERLQTLQGDSSEENVYTMNELRRRLGFEFNGMRLHEYYFGQLEGGTHAQTEGSTFERAVQQKYGSWDAYIQHIKDVAGTRGIGWVLTYFDPVGQTLHTCWIDEHQLGHLSTLPVIFAIDMWEHAYMIDYKPAEKKSYVEAFLSNVNWNVVESRMENQNV